MDGQDVQDLGWVGMLNAAQGRTLVVARGGGDPLRPCTNDVGAIPCGRLAAKQLKRPFSTTPPNHHQQSPLPSPAPPPSHTHRLQTIPSPLVGEG